MLTRSTAPSSQGMLTIDAFVERESAHVSATTAPAASTAAGDSWRSARHVVYAGSVPCAVLEASRVAEAAAVSANDYELVLCRVAVGRAWPICPSLLREKSALELARMRPPQGAHARRPGPRTARLCSGRPRPPAGYDSFVLEDEERTDSETGLRYWMPSAQRLAARPGPPLPLASRVLPCYRVSFAYGKPAVELAAVSPPPATSGHARAEEGQQETQRADGTCRFHRGQPCTYFCAHCQVALCCECKVSGHHSHGSIPSRPRPPLAHACTGRSLCRCPAMVHAHPTGSVSASAAAPDAGPAAHHPLQQLTAAHRAAIGQPQPRRALRGAARVPTLGTPEVAPGHSAQSSPGQWSPRDCADAGWVKHAPVHALLRLRPPAPNARSLVSARTSPSVIGSTARGTPTRNYSTHGARGPSVQKIQPLHV